MSRIGYARVSTIDQGLDQQIAKLRAEGCSVIRSEKGASRHGRAELATSQMSGGRVVPASGYWLGCHLAKAARIGFLSRNLCGTPIIVLTKGTAADNRRLP